MEFTLRYGRLITPSLMKQAAPSWRPPDTLWRPERIVDLMLGLRSEPGYLARLFLPSSEEVAAKWSLAGWPPVTADEGHRALSEAATFAFPDRQLVADALGAMNGGPTSRALNRWLKQKRTLFQDGAAAAAQGELSPQIAAEYARVREHSARTIDAPDLVALAAWCLNHLRPIQLGACELCGLPWVRERGGRFCLRPAPGHMSTCRNLGSVRRYTARNAAFSRERKRLYEQTQRGTLDRAAYRAWKDSNGPGTRGKAWLPYELWLKAGSPALRTAQPQGG